MIIPQEKMSKIVLHENGVEVQAKISSKEQIKFYIGEDDIRSILSLYSNYGNNYNEENDDTAYYDEDSIQDAIY